MGSEMCIRDRGVYRYAMNGDRSNLQPSERDLVISTNTNISHSQIHTGATQSNVYKDTKSVHLISDIRESLDKVAGDETSIRNEDISNETLDRTKIRNEELIHVDIVQKKLDCLDSRFERIERAIFHITEYLTK